MGFGFGNQQNDEVDIVVDPENTSEVENYALQPTEPETIVLRSSAIKITVFFTVFLETVS